MKPSPGIIPQETIIANLQNGKPADNPPVDPAPDMVANGQVASVQAVEKTIIAKLIDALRGMKP